MKLKHLMLIALALCLCVAVAPVAAVWDNGNWVSPDTLVGYNVVHDSTTGVDSKYKDITPTVQGQDGMSAYGGKVYGNVRAGYSTLSPTVAVTNDLAPGAAPMLVDVSPDGTFEIPAWNNGVLSPGNYTATLDNFNLPDETVHFPVVSDRKTFITFIGQATTGLAKVDAIPTPTPPHGDIHILSAVYGATWITYTTETVRGHSHQVPHNNGQYVNIRSELQNLVNGGDTKFQFDVATIRGLTNGDSVTLAGGDPDQGIVKNAIVTYTDNHFPFLHVKTVMEQDFNNPYPQSDSVHVPYHAPTSQTTLTL